MNILKNCLHLQNQRFVFYICTEYQLVTFRNKDRIGDECRSDFRKFDLVFFDEIFDSSRRILAQIMEKVLTLQTICLHVEIKHFIFYNLPKFGTF